MTPAEFFGDGDFWIHVQQGIVWLDDVLLDRPLSPRVTTGIGLRIE